MAPRDANICPQRFRGYSQMLVKTAVSWIHIGLLPKKTKKKMPACPPSPPPPSPRASPTKAVVVNKSLVIISTKTNGRGPPQTTIAKTKITIKITITLMFIATTAAMITLITIAIIVLLSLCFPPLYAPKQ